MSTNGMNSYVSPACVVAREGATAAARAAAVAPGDFFPGSDVAGRWGVLAEATFCALVGGSKTAVESSAICQVGKGAFRRRGYVAFADRRQKS